MLYKHSVNELSRLSIIPESSYLYNDNLSIPDSPVVIGDAVVVASVKKALY